MDIDWFVERTCCSWTYDMNNLMACMACQPQQRSRVMFFTARGMVANMDDWAFKNRARLRYDRFWIKVPPHKTVVFHGGSEGDEGVYPGNPWKSTWWFLLDDDYKPLL